MSHEPRFPLHAKIRSGVLMPISSTPDRARERVHELVEIDPVPVCWERKDAPDRQPNPDPIVGSFVDDQLPSSNVLLEGRDAPDRRGRCALLRASGHDPITEEIAGGVI